MELAMASSYLFEDNEGSEAAGSTGIMNNSSEICQHEYKLDEEIGILCRRCGFVSTEIRDISAPVMQYTSFNTYGKLCNEEDSAHKLEDDEGLDILHTKASSDVPLSEENKNVWALVPELRKKLHVHQKKASEFLWKNIAGFMIELKDAAYQAQDLLDEIATDASLYKLKAELKSKVQLFNLSTSHSSSYKEIELKLDEILGRLKFLAKQRDLIGLKEGGGEKPSPKRPTTSLVEESGVYGRNGDLLKQLIQLYLKDCKRLENLPNEINLESLEIIILSVCSKLKKFPEIGRDMTSLSELYLDGTAIEELPPSIKRLTGLTLQNLQDGKNLLTDDEVGKITEFSFLDMELLNLLNLEDCKNLLTDDECGKITELSFLDIQLQPLWQRFMEEQIEGFYSDFEVQLVPRLIDQSETNETETQLGISDLLVLDFDQCQVYNFCFPLSEIREWFNHRSDEPLLTIPLPPNVYNDSNWMGLALCASVAVKANPDTIIDIQNTETSYNLICHLETSVECVESLHVRHLTKDDLRLLQQGGFIWLSYIPRGSFQDSLNLCTRIEASVATDCPGLVQKCGFHLLYKDDEVEFKETKRQCMELFSKEHELLFLWRLPLF